MCHGFGGLTDSRIKITSPTIDKIIPTKWVNALTGSLSLLNILTLHDCGYPLTGADAHGSETVSTIHLIKNVQESGDQSGTGASQRMAQRYCAAIQIDLFRWPFATSDDEK